MGLLRPERKEAVFDAVLAALHAHPFKIHRPAEQRVPFVFASPHSGRLYPSSFVAASALDPLGLRRSEDAYADVLFAGAVALGAPLIAARFPRAYLDANRAPGELDASMFDGPLSVRADAPNPRVQAGLGVIPRIVRDGAEIYRAKLDPREASRRLEMLHRPYHAALARLVEDTRRQFGVAVVIDCHSMPSAAAIPDIVLGDRYGSSASPLLAERAEASLAQVGFSTARNTPYAGGYTTPSLRTAREFRACAADRDQPHALSRRGAHRAGRGFRPGPGAPDRGAGLADRARHRHAGPHAAECDGGGVIPPSP